MTGWEKTYRNIGYSLLNGAVRVDNSDGLKALSGDRRRATNELAEDIRRNYFDKYGRELGITKRSLAVEISGHYYCQEWMLALEKVLGKKKPTRWVIKHTLIIDCGERDKDGNRIVWDILSKLFR